MLKVWLHSKRHSNFVRVVCVSLVSLDFNVFIVLSCKLNLRLKICHDAVMR